MKEKVVLLVKYLIDESIITMSRNGLPKIGSRSITAHHYKSSIEVIGKEVLKEYDLLLESFESPSLLVEMIANESKKILFAQARASFKDSEFPEQFEVENFRYILDVKADKEHLFNIQFRKVSEVSIAAFKKMLTPEQKAIFMSRPIPSIFSFDPYNISAYRPIVLEGMKLTQFNLYQPPKWMESDKEGNHIIGASDVKLPEIIHEFMSHIFPDPKARAFVWCWMHYALVSRCETYLVLNGKKGLGKGLFVEHILARIVGEDNFKLAPESFLTSDFNSSLDKGRLIYIDEQRVDTELKLNKLKRYINRTQAIERKGVDADKVVDTYNSFVISNNYDLDMRVEWDDRRFSVMDMNKTALREIWGQEKIDEFVELMKNPEVQKMLGYYVLYYGMQDGQDEFTAWKGEHFYHLAYVHLAEWQKVVVDSILSRKAEEYDLRDLRSDYKARVENGRFPVKVDRISSFLENYLHNGVDKLGQVMIRDEQILIIPSDKYKPITLDSDDFNVHDLI
jgi:hypothetical protein